VPFERIKTRKKSAFIIEQITNAIERGEYQAGEKLPAEREIAESMGVSRPSIREALSALQLAGVVEAKSGDGTYVRRSRRSKQPEEEALKILTENEEPYAVWEAREGIEVGIASLVIQNGTTRDTEEMEQAVERMQKTVDNEEYEEFFDADHDFHLLIAESTHNPYIENIVPPLVNVMRQGLWQKINRIYYLESGKGQENLKKALKCHRSILKAMENQVVEEFERAVRGHYKEIKKHLNG